MINVQEKSMFTTFLFIKIIYHILRIFLSIFLNIKNYLYLFFKILFFVLIFYKELNLQVF